MAGRDPLLPNAGSWPGADRTRAHRCSSTMSHGLALWPPWPRSHPLLRLSDCNPHRRRRGRDALVASRRQTVFNSPHRRILPRRENRSFGGVETPPPSASPMAGRRVMVVERRPTASCRHLRTADPRQHPHPGSGCTGGISRLDVLPTTPAGAVPPRVQPRIDHATDRGRPLDPQGRRRSPRVVFVCSLHHGRHLRDGGDRRRQRAPASWNS
jgi:hypothetical protein